MKLSKSTHPTSTLLLEVILEKTRGGVLCVLVHTLDPITGESQASLVFRVRHHLKQRKQNYAWVGWRWGQKALASAFAGQSSDPQDSHKYWLGVCHLKI